MRIHMAIRSILHLCSTYLANNDPGQGISKTGDCFCRSTVLSLDKLLGTSKQIRIDDRFMTAIGYYPFTLGSYPFRRSLCCFSNFFSICFFQVIFLI
jgi:hypothetical protein